MNDDFKDITFSTFSNEKTEFCFEKIKECIEMIKQNNKDMIVSIDAHPITIAYLDLKCGKINFLKKQFPLGIFPYQGIPIYSDDTLIRGKFRLKYESGRVEVV